MQIGEHTLIHGDALAVLQTMQENSIDALVCDPPAGISFMNKTWDSHKGGRDSWIAWLSEIMQEALRCLKPGGHAVVWALPRTSHWTATALENAGFEIRDVITHLFGSGFPKSLDVSKAIDKQLGHQRNVLGVSSNQREAHKKGGMGFDSFVGEGETSLLLTAPASLEAQQWNGWGTALKPSNEHWILCRKPFAEKSIAENVLKWGTGALNIDASRIGTKEDMNARDFDDSRRTSLKFSGLFNGGRDGEYRDRVGVVPNGRFPANTLLSHSDDCVESGCTPDCPVLLLDEQSGTLKTGNINPHVNRANATFNKNTSEYIISAFKGDAGGASRYFQTFFYAAKASSRERNAGCEDLIEKSVGEVTSRIDGSKGLQSPRAGAGRTHGAFNHHPTVKNIKLMRYLVRLVTPPHGIVLDCFTGSGSTLVAAIEEGFSCIGIEQEEEYVVIAQARIHHAVQQIV